MRSSAMTVTVHPTAIVDPTATLGEDIFVGPYCHVGGQVTLGTGSRLISHVIIEGRTRIGCNAAVYPFAVLGLEPQDAKYRHEQTELVIGDNAIIREHVTINRGTPSGDGVTRVGKNVFFLIGAHVGHDCQVGNNVTMANGATLGGYVSVGDFATLGGLAAVHQFVRIGHHAMIGGLAAIGQDVIPYGLAIGNHGWLAGLNVIGLKRHGFSKQVIQRLRSVFRFLFHGGGLFVDRLAKTKVEYCNDYEVCEILNFIYSPSRRSLLRPQGRHH
jgi:UDP-N-acetylglucosamine acyltransferase